MAIRQGRSGTSSDTREMRSSSGAVSAAASSSTVRAASRRTASPDSGARSRRGRRRALPRGGSSRTTCAFVPPNPNALTTARRGPCPPSHSAASRTGRSLPSSSAGCGSSTCRVGGSTPSRSANAALIRPATPAAAIACPIIDLTVPRPTGGPQVPNTRRSVASSASSPAGVPVPCASTSPSAPGSAGSRPASRHARSTARTCPSTSGLMTPAARPSLDDPAPRITAWTRSPARSASDSRLSRTIPVPSARSVPSAARSNGRIVSLGLSARSRLRALHTVAWWAWWTAPASIASACPSRSARTACSTASSDDAHDASSVYAGPRRSKACATRDAANPGTSPVDGSGPSGPSRAQNARRISSSRDRPSSGTSSARIPAI